MRRLALVVVLLLGGCSPAPDVPSPSPNLSLAPASGDTSSGIATDQPCSRSVAAEPDVFDVPFQLQDLEAMIPSPADVDGMVGFEDDLFSHGYHDNAELTSIVPNPPTTCDDLERFGRITGFGIGYARPDDPTHSVLFAVHLFAHEAAAKAWPDAFFGSMAASAGKPGGPTAFTVTQPGGLPDGAVVVEHVGADGVRTWASATRGQIVGWVIDLHPEGEPTVDVPHAAATLVDRIDEVTAGVGADRAGPDAAHLVSAPLPQSAYGERAAGLTWDSFFGGCADAVERGMIAGDQARVDAERFDRVSGCTAMYAPGGAATADGTVRVFSSVSVYETPEGASASQAATHAENEALGGVDFEVSGLGDEVMGQITPVTGGDSSYTDTRVMLQRGPYAATTALHSTAPGNASAEVIDWARALDQRMTEFLGR
jgi:hypothetical protein